MCLNTPPTVDAGIRERAEIVSDREFQEVCGSGILRFEQDWVERVREQPHKFLLFTQRTEVNALREEDDGRRLHARPWKLILFSPGLEHKSAFLKILGNMNNWRLVGAGYLGTDQELRRLGLFLERLPQLYVTSSNGNVSEPDTKPVIAVISAASITHELGIEFNRGDLEPFGFRCPEGERIG